MMYLKLNESESRTKLELLYSNDDLQCAVDSINRLVVKKNLTAEIHVSFSAYKYILYQVLRDGVAYISLEDHFSEDSPVFNITGLKYIESDTGPDSPNDTIFTVKLEYVDSEIIEGF